MHRNDNQINRLICHQNEKNCGNGQRCFEGPVSILEMNDKKREIKRQKQLNEQECPRTELIKQVHHRVNLRCEVVSQGEHSDRGIN